MRNVYAFYAHKGGVGKTTCLIHVAVKALMERKRVVVIDCDPQLNATSFFLNYNKDPEGPSFDDFYHALVRFDELSRIPMCDITPGQTEEKDAFPYRSHNLWDILRYLNSTVGFVPGLLKNKDFGFPISTRFPGQLRLVASHPMLWEHENNLDNHRGRAMGEHKKFRLAVDHITDKYKADLVLLDLSPGNSLLNQHFIFSSDYILLPCTGDEFSSYSIKSFGLWLASASRRWMDKPSHPKLLSIIYNGYKRHTAQDGATSAIKMGGKTMNTTAAHIKYLEALKEEEGPIKTLLKNNPELEIKDHDYARFPLICNALSTSSRLSALHRTAYDAFTAEISSSDRETCRLLCEEYDFLWDIIEETLMY